MAHVGNRVLIGRSTYSAWHIRREGVTHAWVLFRMMIAHTLPTFMTVLPEKSDSFVIIFCALPPDKSMCPVSLINNIVFPFLPLFYSAISWMHGRIGWKPFLPNEYFKIIIYNNFGKKYKKEKSFIGPTATPFSIWRKNNREIFFCSPRSWYPRI